MDLNWDDLIDPKYIEEQMYLYFLLQELGISYS